MSKFSNGPLTPFNGPCCPKPTTPVIIDPATQEEIKQYVLDVFNSLFPMFCTIGWQFTEQQAALDANKAFLPGWHRAAGQFIDNLTDASGVALSPTDKAALKAQFGQNEQGQYVLTNSDNTLVHTYGAGVVWSS